jgi:hypothetical protein
LTAVYNAEAFLERSLRTLLAQTYRDFEALVIDDGSEDGSAAVVETLAESDSRIRLIRQANAGVSGALNRGLGEARGELIALLDHDDLWHPTKLERQIEALDRDHRVGFVGCYSTLVDEEGRSVGWRFGSSAHGDVYRRMLFCDLVAGGSVALVRRAAFEQAGSFDPAPEIAGRSDWDMWLRIARSWHYASVDDSLVGYTRSPRNYSRDYPKMLAAGEAVLAKAAASDPGLDPATVDRALARDAFGIFCLCIADGEVAAARTCMRRSLSLSWRPVVLSPKRWGGVLGLALASLLPRAVFDRLWGIVARFSFGLGYRQSFLASASARKIPSARP